MIINNITRYHASDLKPKAFAKPITNAGSRAAPHDTYESSGPDRLERPSPSFEARGDLIRTVKKRIQSGYYNSKDVLDDLSNSFAKALHQTLL
jgi:hypothetical protein